MVEGRAGATPPAPAPPDRDAAILDSALGTRFAGRNRYADFTHELAFTQTSMSQVLRATGFADIRVLPNDPPPHGALSAARLVIWRLFAAILSVGLIAETGVVRAHILTQNLVAVASRPRADSVRR